MAYCRYCGSKMGDGAKFCPACGAEVIASAQKPVERYDDSPSPGFALLSFFFPLVGLILFVVWMNDYPRKSKSCGIGALVGFVVQIIFFLAFWSIFWARLFRLFSGYF